MHLSVHCGAASKMRACVHFKTRRGEHPRPSIRWHGTGHPSAAPGPVARGARTAPPRPSGTETLPEWHKVQSRLLEARITIHIITIDEGAFVTMLRIANR